MAEEMRFFMYLLEYYSAYKNKKTGDVLKEWERNGIIKKIYDNYWMYHIRYCCRYIRHRSEYRVG